MEKEDKHIPQNDQSNRTNETSATLKTSRTASGRNRLSRTKHAPFGLEEAFIFGYNVEQHRRKANMNVTTFARLAGISRPTVYKIEKGESDLQLSFIKKIADTLGTTVVELLSEPPNKNSKLPFELWFKQEKAKEKERKRKIERAKGH